MSIDQQLDKLRFRRYGIQDDVIDAVVTNDRPLTRDLDIYGYDGEVIGTISHLLRERALNTMVDVMWRDRYD